MLNERDRVKVEEYLKELEVDTHKKNNLEEEIRSSEELLRIQKQLLKTQEHILLVKRKLMEEFILKNGVRKSN